TIVASLVCNAAVAQEMIFQGLKSATWGYPTTAYTPGTSYRNNPPSIFSYQVVRPRSFLPSLSFLVASGVPAWWQNDKLSEWSKPLELTDLGLYLSFRSAGNVYFHGLVSSPVHTFADEFEQSFDDTRNIDFHYRGALGVTLGPKGAFNLQLEFLGTRMNNQLDTISIGARYSF
ncbi:uncharacterized protein METZ01_LOCUS230935, partial [marine metagenome]